MIFEKDSNSKRQNQLREAILFDLNSDFSKPYPELKYSNPRTDELPYPLPESNQNVLKSFLFGIKPDENIKQLLNPRLKTMATIYLKHPITELKRFEKKAKNEPLRIPKTLKDDLYPRPKVSPLVMKPIVVNSKNEINLPEMKLTPQKNANFDEIFTSETKIPGKNNKEQPNMVIPHKRASSNSSCHPIYDPVEKKSNEYDFLDNLIKENEVKKFSLKTESQPEALIFKEKVKSAVEPQKKRDPPKKQILPIKANFNFVANNKQEAVNFNLPARQETLNNTTTTTNLQKSSLGSPKASMTQDEKESEDRKLLSSPYFSKNLQEEEQVKVLQSLKTKERGKERQYNTRIMKSKKCDVDTLEYVLKGKYTLNHRTNMEEYLKKVGLKEQTKVFCCNTQDEHIRRALLALGWSENKNSYSSFFDLKWVYMDNENDYKNLIEGQYYNHFQNNKELTTKIGLTNNLKDFCEYGVNFDQFYPRCYDLGNNKELLEFTADFEHTNMMILLKKHVKYFKMRCGYLKELKEEIKKKTEMKKRRNEKEVLVRMNRRKPKHIFKVTCYNENKKDKDFLINLNLMQIAMCYYKTLYHQTRNFLDEGKYYYDLSTIDKQFKQDLMSYSKLNPPYDPIPESERKKKGFFLEHWQTPNRKFISTLIKYYKTFKAFYPQFRIDGLNNIWIIKPGGNSRGNGIHLITSIDEAVDSGTNMKARIIQKYIENPLIVTNNFKPLQKKKFDIRQWVLVKSFYPLKIFMFSTCYLRICSSEFNLENVKSLFSHLTNFSLNKTAYQAKNISLEDSVCDLDTFKHYLSTSGDKTWDADIKPKVKQVIINALRSVQDAIEQKPQSFELFGFDLMLDDKLNVWLLEVNLSPACSERTDWLSSMLDDMSYGLLKIALPSDWVQGQERATKHQWELIFSEKEEVKDNNVVISSNINKLEIEGFKADMKKERNIDKKYYALIASITVQKFVRMFLAKRKKKFLKETKASICIQKFARCYLAKKLRKKLKRNLCAKKIQTFWRMFSARKKFQIYKKSKKVTKIQSLYRKRKATQYVQQVRRTKNAIKIQKICRMVLAKKKMQERKEFHRKLAFLQIFWKMKFRKRIKCLRKIQKSYQKYKNYRTFKKKMHFLRQALEFQKIVRRWCETQLQKQLKMIGCLLILQRFFKRKLAEKTLFFLKRQKSVQLLIKSFTKTLKGRALSKLVRTSKQRQDAAFRIQGLRKVVRAKKMRKRLILRKTIIKIQSFIRMVVSMKLYRRMRKEHQSAVKIQRRFRKFINLKRIRIYLENKLKSNMTKNAITSNQNIESKPENTNNIKNNNINKKKVESSKDVTEKDNQFKKQKESMPDKANQFKKQKEAAILDKDNQLQRQKESIRHLYDPLLKTKNTARIRLQKIQSHRDLEEGAKIIENKLYKKTSHPIMIKDNSLENTLSNESFSNLESTKKYNNLISNAGNMINNLTKIYGKEKKNEGRKTENRKKQILEDQNINDLLGFFQKKMSYK